MARKKVIFVTTLIFICFGLFAIFVEVQFLNYCPICYQKEPLFTYRLDYDEKYVLSPEIDCKKNPPFLVLLVTTTYDQKPARMAIRQSWGKARTIKGNHVVSFFLLGATASPQDQASLVEESKSYRDIMQRDFIDAYSNLTIKTIMGIDWIHHFCPETSYAMKVDTDVFVNTLYLVDLLLRKNKTSNFFTGFLKPNEYPIRSPFSKWYASVHEYPDIKYPPFCSGTGYVFSVDVAHKIHNITAVVPFFKLEDVYIGLCLDRLKIPLDELHTEQTFFPDRISFSVCNYRKIITSHGMNPHEIELYWKTLESSADEKC
ncbi:beta-1,3-galactosyltransferase 5 [Pelodytes ibericus]